MKAKRPRSGKSSVITNSRWATYATAGAATALAASPSLEAAIHYSGLLEIKFPRHEDKIRTFQLDQPGDSIRFRHVGGSNHNGSAFFQIFGIFTHSFRGFNFDYFYVSKVTFGQEVSEGGFAHPSYSALMANYNYGFWKAPGTGFVGFKFNGAHGLQYGWARVRMGGKKKNNGFMLMDYAYADPFEPIRAGQISRDGQGPDLGSLGLLAAGAVGVIAWRKSRSRRAA